LSESNVKEEIILAIISYKTVILLVEGKTKDKFSSFDTTSHIDKACPVSDLISGALMTDEKDRYGNGI
jgi:hypothetical protein